ncbi:MAG: serine hydrolase [Acidobacteria bacterium]|nr:MAG: serine hydrolase [Acidobacteriota bacterium]REK01653.1 MAG: serine hydrolase [Acidobacteriota bacterium]REK14609.1 MAG: serine hydrolase [Acidobacteriota bacterium]REK45324.1 MAG: serine hydrolase [Acidobacteriota bacterium]
MKNFTNRLISLFVVFLAAATIAAGQQDPLVGFDDYVNKAIAEWEVPGVAIAIVKDDQIVFAKGFGVRKLGDATPVDENTLFAIGSSSKAFTAATVAILVDEGKLKWNDPAAEHLPGFQLFDPYVSKDLTIRDTLSHRSGLQRGDFLWYGTDRSREEILRQVRFIEPSWSFRSNFGYQNLMFLAAGEIVAKKSGKSWDAFVDERIFTPLGMEDSNTSIKAFRDGANIATPHSKIDGEVRQVPWRDIDNIAPAGSINSNVVEMAQWIRLQLGEGKYGEKRIFSSGAWKQMHTPQTIISLAGNFEILYPEAHFLSYGLGWFLSDYKGKKLVEHGGAIDGMRAEVALLPEENLGVVILTNLNGTALPHFLTYRVLDLYLGKADKDWAAEGLKTFKALEAAAEEAQKKAEEARIKGTSPSLKLGDYAGTYKNDLYGEVTIKNNGGKLRVRFGPAFEGDLEHWHYDTFRANFAGPLGGNTFVTFSLNAQGKVDDVTLGLVSDYPFDKVPEAAKAEAKVEMSEAELKTLAGQYASEAPPIEISIEFVAGELKVVIPGQPVYTLVPQTKTKFAIKGLPEGFFVEFTKEGDSVKSATFIQGPAGSLELKRKQ